MGKAPLTEKGNSFAETLVSEVEQYLQRRSASKNSPASPVSLLKWFWWNAMNLLCHGVKSTLPAAHSGSGHVAAGATAWPVPDAGAAVSRVKILEIFIKIISSSPF